MREAAYLEIIEYADKFRIDPAVKWLLMKMALLIEMNGGNIQASAESLTRMIGSISTRTIQRHISILRKRGVLVVTNCHDNVGRLNANIYSMPEDWRKL